MTNNLIVVESIYSSYIEKGYEMYTETNNLGRRITDQPHPMAIDFDIHGSFVLMIAVTYCVGCFYAYKALWDFIF